MTENGPRPRTGIVPVWRCPFCIGEDPPRLVYLELPALKAHLREEHDMEWSEHVGKGCNLRYRSWLKAHPA